MGDFSKAHAMLGAYSEGMVEGYRQGYEQGWRDAIEAALGVMDQCDLEYDDICQDIIRRLTPKDTSHD